MEDIEVYIKGYIDQTWSDWLEGLAVTHTAEGETVLSGAIQDQSALYGLLNRLSGLGLHLVSVSSHSMPPGPLREVTNIAERLAKRS
jgi:hypothetical protein